MKRITILIVFLCTCLASVAGAQDPLRYTVQDLGTLGGTFSFAGGITNNGLVEGVSTLPGDTSLHALLWQKPTGMTDLGTLGGPNSEGYGLNESGEVVGESEASALDPNGEDFCGFGTHLICLPFIWRHGVMTPLPLLGGNNGFATRVNNQGQAVGNAEYNTPDPTCVFRIGVVVWENGKIIKILPPLPGDPDATPYAINDWGQVTGASGDCSSSDPLHAVLWQDGKVTNLGSLGGTRSVGIDINNQGQVVGNSWLTGQTAYHAFLWQKRTGMIDLGTLSGDVYSTGDGINGEGQVVGGSYDIDFNERTFLWQKRTGMIDLNTLIPPGSPLFLLEADGINDWGQIVGYAYQISTGDLHAYLATPTWWSWAISERPKVVLSENARKQLQQRRVGRFGVKLTRPQ